MDMSFDYDFVCSTVFIQVKQRIQLHVMPMSINAKKHKKHNIYINNRYIKESLYLQMQSKDHKGHLFKKAEMETGRVRGFTFFRRSK